MAQTNYALEVDVKTSSDPNGKFKNYDYSTILLNVVYKKHIVDRNIREVTDTNTISIWACTVISKPH